MINVAIIGTGAISHAHVKAYLAFPERCRIVAVCDIYVEKAAALAKQYGLDAAVLKNSDDLLAADVQLVSICTPPYLHADLAVQMLRAGKHVIVEKPMASSLEECDRMLEAERESGRILSIVAQNRFRNPMMKLKGVLDTGLIGKVLHVQVDSYWWRGHCYYDLWWRGTWEKECGGCTINHAVHHIDALLWMKGMPAEVQAIAANTAHDNAEVEDLSVAILRYADGSLGQITSSVVHHGEEQQLIFQGQHARVSVPWKVKASVSKSNGFPQPNPELERELQSTYDGLPDVEHEGHIGQISDVLDAIETGRKVYIDGVSGKATLELITAIYKASATGQKVELPLRSDDPFYTREGILKNAEYFYEKTNSVENFKSESITLGRDL